ncbi:hypothetical protein [Stieleria marina]|uniref:Uncharacterized protein n=1 Tax=Stieleria marina TaxID=1930275 RepID=A0A517NSP5_9BACT|nr:hypothetical protein K239x_21070 [Planctomycetes bacterium K23_9]
MRITQVTHAFLLGFCLVGFTGCGGDTATEPVAESHSEHDHDHGDHDHEGHDHDEHAGHDHEGHDHDGDGHDDHATTKQIDASAAGLTTDDLVSLDEPPLPESYSAAVAELDKLSSKIAQQIKSGDIKDDHGALHGVSALLDGVDALANKSSMDSDAKEAIHQSVEKLLDAYGDVDYRLHDSSKGKDYSDVAEQIQSAIKTLQSYAK